MVLYQWSFSVPKHPASNGLPGRYVRSFKEAMEKMEKSEDPLDTKLSRFLLAQHTTPQATTGKSPSELLMNKKLKTRLDLFNLLSQDITHARVEEKQKVQKTFMITMSIKENFRSVIQYLLRISHMVQSGWVEPFWTSQDQCLIWYNSVCRRHLDHMRLRSISLQPTSITFSNVSLTSAPATQPLEASTVDCSTELDQAPVQPKDPEPKGQEDNSGILRRSTRTHNGLAYEINGVMFEQ